MIWCIKTYIIAYVKTQKNKIYYPLCQTYSPTVVYNSISKRWTNMQDIRIHNVIYMAVVHDKQVSVDEKTLRGALQMRPTNYGRFYQEHDRN